VDSSLNYTSCMNVNCSDISVKLKRYELTENKRNFDIIALCLADLLVHIKSNGINFSNFHINNLDFNEHVYSLVDIGVNLMVDGCTLSYWSLVSDCLIFEKTHSASSITRDQISELLFASKLLNCIKEGPLNTVLFLDFVNGFCSYDARALIESKLNDFN